MNLQKTEEGSNIQLYTHLPKMGIGEYSLKNKKTAKKKKNTLEILTCFSLLSRRATPNPHHSFNSPGIADFTVVY